MNVDRGGKARKALAALKSATDVELRKAIRRMVWDTASAVSGEDLGQYRDAVVAGSEAFLQSNDAPAGLHDQGAERDSPEPRGR